jgi:hypothetical protein
LISWTICRNFLRLTESFCVFLADDGTVNLYYDIQMIPSGKGGTCLLLHDFKFTLHVTNNDGVCYYRCKDHTKK